MNYLHPDERWPCPESTARLFDYLYQAYYLCARDDREAPPDVYLIVDADDSSDDAA